MRQQRKMSIGLAVMLAPMLFAAASAQVPLTYEQQAELERERRAQAAETERQRQQLAQQHQQTQQMLMQSQMAAAQAKSEANLAEAQWTGSAAALGLQSGMQGFQDRNEILSRNAGKQLLMIQQAAMSYLANRKQAGNETFQAAQLANPFATGETPNAAPARLPQCMVADPALGAVIVKSACGPETCAGRLQEGDILLSADGTPAYSETAVSAYLQSCSSADAALIVYRPSVADVVTIR